MHDQRGWPPKLARQSCRHPRGAADQQVPRLFFGFFFFFFFFLRRPIKPTRRKSSATGQPHPRCTFVKGPAGLGLMGWQVV